MLAYKASFCVDNFIGCSFCINLWAVLFVSILKQKPAGMNDYILEIRHTNNNKKQNKKKKQTTGLLIKVERKL